MTTGKWLLPNTINPPDTVCVQIQVPNDLYHRAAFWGALNELTMAWNWEDSFGDGSTVAYLWRDIIKAATDAVRNGENCQMPIDCAEVEACLATSAIIQNLQSQITANDGDISSLQSAVIDNQAAITANANNITTLRNDVDQILNVDLPQIQINHDNQQTTLNNHETRITALENAGGGGGSGTPQTILIKELIETVIVSVDGSNIPITIPDGYLGLEVEAHVTHDGGSTTLKTFGLRFNDDSNNSNYSWDGEAAPSQVGMLYAFFYGDGTVNHGLTRFYIPDIQANRYKAGECWTGGMTGAGGLGMATRSFSWHNVAQITKIDLEAVTGTKFKAGSYVHVWGIKEQQVLVPSSNLIGVIDFDGGLPFTLVQTGNASWLPSGGNPDGHIDGYVNIDNLSFRAEYDEPDVGTVKNVVFDVYAPVANGQIWFAVSKLGGASSFSWYPPSVGWHTVDWLEEFPSENLEGNTVIGIKASANLGSIGTDTVSGIKIDNIRLYN